MTTDTQVGANVNIINDNGSLDDALVRATKENGAARGHHNPHDPL